MLFLFRYNLYKHHFNSKTMPFLFLSILKRKIKHLFLTLITDMQVERKSFFADVKIILMTDIRIKSRRRNDYLMLASDLFLGYFSL